MSESNIKLKIFIHSAGALGHINSCVGIGQALIERGHRIHYLIDSSLGGQFVQYGFEEILLYDKDQLQPTTNKTTNVDINNNSTNATNGDAIKELCHLLLDSGMLSISKPLDVTKQSNNSQFFERLFRKSVEFNEQIGVAIEQEKPDLIVVDTFFIEPSIVHSGIPWMRLHSSNPIGLYNSRKLPPISSGYSVYSNPEEWVESQKAADEKYRYRFGEKQNQLMKLFNYPPIKLDGHRFSSPYLNLYGFPEELDYHDLVPRPINYISVDAFCRTIPGKFELPHEFRQKIKPGDKLVYVSLGSMGSANIDLMKRLVEILGKTKHWYIVSKGMRHCEYELKDNMWGEEQVPQTSILPMVDLVITHGGNNTITETFSFGKPMIVMPMFADQFDNAQRIQDKGFGIRLNTHDYTEQELIDSVNRLLNDTELNQKLRTISERIQHSNSKEKACIAIEQMVDKHRNKTN